MFVVQSCGYGATHPFLGYKQQVFQVLDINCLRYPDNHPNSLSDDHHFLPSLLWYHHEFYCRLR